MREIIVVGGGAAGMMAAVTAAQSGSHVTLLEKNEKLGKKLFITGKGRCNVTNAAALDVLFANVCTNPKFLYSAFYDYDNRAVMDFLEKEGCPLKIERGERVFPVSDHSSDVLSAFQRALKKQGVEICLHTAVKELLTEIVGEEGGEKSGEEKRGTEKAAGEKMGGGKFAAETCFSEESMNENVKKKFAVGERITGVKLEDGRILRADAVILCTGGLSYPSTGSTGDGHRFAQQTGHAVTECRPSLVPLETAEDWCRDLMGLSLKNVELTLSCGSRELYREFGEMLFTHFGVSGPLVLTASCYYAEHIRRQNKKQEGKREKKQESKEEIQMKIDLKPALDLEQLDKRILRDFEEQSNKQFKNALGGLFPAKLIPVMVMLSDIDPNQKVNTITREERRAFAELIKNLPLTVTGTRTYAEAIVTQGGVAVKEVNPSTMESKKVKGLYFAGELLDLDAHTGGFNLQIAWSTGHLAGSSAARE